MDDEQRPWLEGARQRLEQVFWQGQPANQCLQQYMRQTVYAILKMNGCALRDRRQSRLLEGACQELLVCTHYPTAEVTTLGLICTYTERVIQLIACLAAYLQLI
jgi:hypothetical protein